MKTIKLSQTKFIPHRLSKYNVSRVALVKKIEASKEAIILLTGPVGTGKSTVMRQVFNHLSATNMRVMWLKIDPDLSTGIELFNYLLEAFSQLGMLSQSERLRCRNVVSLDPKNIHGAFRELRVALSFFTKRAALFVDNFHHIIDPQLIKEINILFDDKPDGLKILIASRNSIGLQVHRRVLENGLLIISQTDLNFSGSETDIFFGKALELKIDTKVFAKTLELTEGWIGALRCVSIAINKDPHFVCTNIELAILPITSEYMFEDIFMEAPESVQHFLLYSSQMRQFNAEIYEYVSEDFDARSSLAWIVSHNAFIIDLKSTGQWFRYHPLFVNFLDQKWSETGKSATSILEKSSSWCQAMEYRKEAVEFLLMSNQYEKAAVLIKDLSQSTLRISGDVITVLNWVNRLPLDVQKKYSSLAFDYGLALCMTRQGEKARQLIPYLEQLQSNTKAISSAEQIDEADLATKSIMIAACSSLDENHTALKLLDSLLPKVPFERSLSSGSILCASTYCRILSFDFEIALQHASQAHLFGIMAHSPYIRVCSICFKAMAYIKMGNLESAEKELDEIESDSLHQFDKQNFVNLLIKLLRGEIAFWKGDFNACNDFLIDGWALIDNYGYPEILINALKARVWLAEIQETGVAANKIISNGEGLGVGPRMLLSLNAEKIAILGIQGKHAELELVANTYDLHAKSWEDEVPESGPILDLIQRRAIAEYRISRKNPLAAIDILNALCVDPNFHQLKPELIRIYILLAFAKTKCSDVKGAKKAFDTGLKLAFSSRIVAPFMMYKSYVQHITNQLELETSSRNGDRYGAEYSWFCNFFGPIGTNRSVVLNEHLSDFTLTSREIEILHFIKEGLGNNQLAEKLDLKLATVKWHVHNILQKMNVKNRTAAIAVADHHNLFESATTLHSVREG